MNEELPTRRVEVTFVGLPACREIARASGVSEVEVDGSRLRCVVSGSVQPFLEALHGYEVVDLTSSPALAMDAHGEPKEDGLDGDRGGG